MRPIFKVVFAEKNTCGSHEECMRPTKKRTRHTNANVEEKTLYPN